MKQRLYPVPFTAVQITDTFWRPRMERHREAILADLRQCETTGRLDNFKKAAGLMKGAFIGIFFNDSDVYKVLEGIAYYLQNIPDPTLEKRADVIIADIAAAQWADGYINTYFTLVKGDDGQSLRWTDMEKHETYCGGHLLEAGIAYKAATGKETLFQTAKKFADHLYERFYLPKEPWVTGHQEIELALLKLFDYTGEDKYRALAQYFLDQRGHGHGQGTFWDGTWGTPEHCQDMIPVEDLRVVSGHAVRAMYMYTAMTDIMASSDDGCGKYETALDSLWDSVVNRNMYITGGIGSSATNEGFTKDYDLPNKEAYCETCASFGMVIWNHRMNLYKGTSPYADVMERALYNGLLAGISLSGIEYFYVNPLASDGTHHRQPWFDCSCCPSQAARFLPSVGGFLYAHNGSDGLYVNVFAASSADIILPNGNKAVIRQETAYPWDGCVLLHIDEWTGMHTLHLRVPQWCTSFSVLHNGQATPISLTNGYMAIDGINAGDTITYHMDMPFRFETADPRVEGNRGKICLMRGPLVYCVEETDNPSYDIQIDCDNVTQIIRAQEAGSVLPGDAVLCHVYSRAGDKRLTAIPYFLWDNREPGRMDVWIPVPAKASPLK